MSALGFIAAVFGGGVLGVLVRTGYERAERARERLLSTAERFLAAHENARDAISRHGDRAAETMAAAAVVPHAEQAEAAEFEAVEPGGAGPIHDARERIHRALIRWMPHMHPRYNEGWDELTRQQFDLQLQDARDRLAAEIAAGNLPATLEAAVANTIDAVETWARRNEESAAAFGASLDAQYRLADAFARVMVVFAPRRRLTRTGLRFRLVRTSPSIDAAGAVTTAISHAGSVVTDEQQAGRSPGPDNQAVTAAVNAAAAYVPTFALATNADTRRRFWI